MMGKGFENEVNAHFKEGWYAIPAAVAVSVSVSSVGWYSNITKYVIVLEKEFGDN